MTERFDNRLFVIASERTHYAVMAGQIVLRVLPAIHDLRRNSIILKEVVDDRDKPGHDEMTKRLFIPHPEEHRMSDASRRTWFSSSHL